MLAKINEKVALVCPITSLIQLKRISKKLDRAEPELRKEESRYLRACYFWMYTIGSALVLLAFLVNKL